MPRLAGVNQTAEDIYSILDLTHFRFATRADPFDWRLLHGLDVDDIVRLNDIASLETIIPTLLSGSSDADPSLSHQNYVQLHRLVQLSVEHLWQMRESHAKLYPAYLQAQAAAVSWKTAAGTYLELAGRLLQQLQSDGGALLTEDALNKVAVAREELQEADSRYNTALDRLESEDASARRHSLRQKRLDISWRLVFGVDVQRLVATGEVGRLEQLLPQVAYGNIMSEDPAELTPRHFWQLLALGQACLDYLWAICLATSRVMEQQVQQLAADSAAIPEMTTQTEYTRAALAAALSNTMLSIQAVEGSQGSPRRIDMHTASASAASPRSPQRHDGCGNVVPGSPCGFARWVDHQREREAPGRCCHAGAVGCGHMVHMLAPAAGMLRTKMDQLDWDIRVERQRTEAMRMTLAEATDRLEQLLNMQQRQPKTPKPLVPPSISSLIVEPPQSRESSRASSPPGHGAVRVIIDEDTLRAQEREAAAHQLHHRIHDIMHHHEFSRRLRNHHVKHAPIGGYPRVSFASVSSSRPGGGSPNAAFTPIRAPGAGVVAGSPAHLGAQPEISFFNPSGLRVKTKRDSRSPTSSGHSSPAMPPQQRSDDTSAALEQLPTAEDAAIPIAADAAVVVHRVTEISADGQKGDSKSGSGGRTSLEKVRDFAFNRSPKRSLASSSSKNAREQAKSVAEMVAAAARKAQAAGTHGLGKQEDGVAAAGADEQQDGHSPPKRVSHLMGWHLPGLGSKLPKRNSAQRRTGDGDGDDSPPPPAAAATAITGQQQMIGRSGSSFSTSSVAKAADITAAVEQRVGRPLTTTEAAAMSPLRSSMLASKAAS